MSIPIDITIYSLSPLSTIDSPDYKFNSNQQITLESHAFATLSSLHDQIIERTQTGFLRSQFFRLCLSRNFQFADFIDSTEKLHLQIPRVEETSDILQLVLVRYTKAQAQQLKIKVTTEELFLLDLVLRYKRKYNRMPSQQLDDQLDDQLDETQQNQAKRQAAGLVSACQSFYNSAESAFRELSGLTNMSVTAAERAAHLVCGGDVGMGGLVHLFQSKMCEKLLGGQFGMAGKTRFHQIEVPLHMVDRVQRRIIELTMADAGK
ncbi:hypothetical protein SS50377_27309 [Spironucleus salmonicida]|uniref:Uncharacterized protein n=1 Tax=Spironucleus salmonicida TaxID=348837 RepID=V6LRH3_9EUKA|nr:hypothetical protein SS50377_27309 [Spironucleus salmonicida]|eukprot:EST43389.1 Hypothetical protein SS50377_17069 [Spironucleus salmonicida]